MRTTLDIDDRLMRTAKKAAVERGTSLTRLIEDSLRASLARSRRSKPYKYRPVLVRGKTRPGVDITDRNSLYDIMDGFA